MKFSRNNEIPEPQSPGAPGKRPGHLRWKARCAALLVVGAVFVAAQQNQQNGQQSNSAQPKGDATPDRAWTTSGEIAIPMPQNGKQNFDAANAERRKQIADDSARLLKLATDLKTEVDKTTKDTLSLSVIRKADEIEKLAHGVKEKMKLSEGTN
jgi:hypothetical protein